MSIRSVRGRRVAFLSKEIRVGFTEEVELEERCGRSEGISIVGVWKRSLSG